MTRLGLIVLFSGLAAAPAAAQEQLWIRQFGSVSTDEARALCTDGAGGAFAAGVTYGSLGGPGAGGGDAWLARNDSAGDQTWIRQFGSGDWDQARAVCPDGAGGAFVAGFTYGNLGGPNAGAEGDAWLARYDSAGNRTWVLQFGTSDDDWAHALCPDGAGGAFVAGSTWGSLGGPGGGCDAWLARYDSAGNQTWIRQFGSGERDIPYALCRDGTGGAFVAGFTEGSLGGPSAGSADAWVARYDSAGNQAWVRQFGTSLGDQSNALCPDGAGGAFVAGNTSGSLGAPSAGLQDAWLARYDSAGNRTWIRQFGTSGHDWANALFPDGAGGAFAAGETTGSLGGPHAGSWDAWLARYDSAGNRTWVRQFGTSSDDSAYALGPDGTDGAFVAGRTYGSLGGPNAGGYDVWLARYGAPPCYANCDGSTASPVLNVNDFVCFLNRFAAGDTYANCDGSTAAPVLNVNDFICFTNAFAAGCP